MKKDYLAILKAETEKAEQEKRFLQTRKELAGRVIDVHSKNGEKFAIDLNRFIDEWEAARSK